VFIKFFLFLINIFNIKNKFKDIKNIIFLY
jgi:hypothetical protein